MRLKYGFGLILVFLFGLQWLRGLDESRVQEFTLANGLRVITYEMHTAPLIYSRLTYQVGSKYEPYNQTGISHIVEHMMFKGTKRFGKGTIAELISANGGVFNAFTSTDITVYYELMPKNKIELAFDIESERMYRCVFDPAEFESELKVIREERKQRTDNSATGLRREELNTLLYKSHPYRNPVIGWMEDLEAITRDQAYAYYRKYYTPNNATLVLVGDFDTPAIMALVQRYFGRVPRGPELEQPRFFRVAQQGKKTFEFRHSDITTESVALYFAAPPYLSEDGAALYVAGRIIGSRSATSRLHKRLVRRERLCKSATASLTFSKDPGTFNIVAQLMPGSAMAAVENLIWQEIDSLARYPVSEYDLQKIKNRIYFDEMTGDQYVDKLGEQIGQYESYFGWRMINRRPEMVMAVTPDDIMRVVRQYLTPRQMVVCYSYPDTVRGAMSVPDSGMITAQTETPDELPVPEISLAAPTRAKSSLWQRLIRQPADVRTQYRPVLDQIIGPSPIAGCLDSLILANGVPVYLLINRDFPTIYLKGFIETGRLPEDRERPGIRQFTESMLSRGTLSRSYDELIEEKSFTPYQFEISQSWHNIYLMGYCLRKDADKMLQLAYETLAEPSFPEDQIELLRPKAITNARQFKQTEDTKAFYAMFETIFENHPYSVSHAGEAWVYESLTRDELVRFYDKYYSPERLKLLVVGDFEKDWLEARLNATLGRWQKPSGDEWLTFPGIAPVQGKRVMVFTNPQYKQCRIDIGFQPVAGGLRTDNPDLTAIEILESILCGSSLTSRMGKKLRDELGLSYGIKSNLWIRREGGYWNIRTHTDKDNVTAMIQGILAEIRRVQNELVSEDELNRAKARKIALLPLYVRTPDDIGNVLFSQLTDNLPRTRFDQSRDRILNVTHEDVRRVARRYLDAENYVIGVSGNLAENSLDQFK